MQYFEKVKKNKVDKCNICGQTRELTWEHVPSRSCGNLGAYCIQNIFNVEKINGKLDSQNGIKYRTICSDCNNNILGAKADLDFESFYKQIKQAIEDKNNAGKPIVVNINLVNVIKCLFGKFLAMDKDYVEDKISQSMRNFILNNKIENNLHVYFRLYPYNTSIQTRTYSIKQVSGIKYCTEGIISLLYFYPVAFILSSQEEKINMTDLIKYVNFTNPYINLIIDTKSCYNPTNKKLLPFDWLSSTEDDDGNSYIIFTGEYALHRLGVKKTTN